MIRNMLMHGFHLFLRTLGVGGIRDTQCGFKVGHVLDTSGQATHVSYSLARLQDSFSRLYIFTVGLSMLSYCCWGR